MDIWNDIVLKATCWTLVHSLWQGFLLALVAGAVIVATRKASALLRYNLLSILALSFILVVGFTFYHEMQSEKLAPLSDLTAAGQIHAIDQNTIVPGMQQGTADDVISVVSLADETTDFLNHYASWIVLAWFVVFSIKCLGIFSGLKTIFRLRNQGVTEPSAYWKQRVSELQHVLKIRRKVRLFESPFISIPAVTGFFKPVILVPAGMLLNLSQDQVEAILLHELAHIRRKDYLVNLVQSFMEIVFFFNPGVLWLSTLLKNERENCCDDIAIAITQSKTGFVHALVSFQEYNLSVDPALAMRFGNKKMSMLDRAKRILQNSNQPLNKLEKTFLGACLVLTTALIYAFSSIHEPPVPPTPPVAAVSPAAVYSPEAPWEPVELNYPENTDPKAIPDGTSIQSTKIVDGCREAMYIFKHKGVLYEVLGDISSLKVDSREIPQKDWQHYLPTVKMLILKHRGESWLEQARDTTKAVLMAERKKALAESHEARVEAQQAMADSRKAQAESRQAIAEAKIAAAEAEKVRAESEKTALDSEERSEKILREIENEMGGKVKITSYKLNEKILIVNGKKQSSEMQKRIADKYVTPGMSVYYNYDVKP